MDVTLLPISTKVRLEQSKKAFSPNCVTLWGIITDSSLEQPSKAPQPMDVKLLERGTEVRLLQSQYLQLIVYQLSMIKTVEK